jgi:hypothetical protein
MSVGVEAAVPVRISAGHDVGVAGVRQRLQHDCTQLRRDLRIELTGRARRLGHVQHRHVQRIVGGEGQVAGEYLLQDHTGRIQIALQRGVGRRDGLLRRDVQRRSENLAARARFHQQRQVEVGQNGAAQRILINRAFLSSLFTHHSSADSPRGTLQMTSICDPFAVLVTSMRTGKASFSSSRCVMTRIR